MSSINKVIDRLVEVADEAAPDHDVTDGIRANNLPKKFVAFGDVIEGRQEYRAMRTGAKPRQEYYRVVVHIVSIIGGAAPGPARTDTMTVWEDFGAAIAVDPSLGLDPGWIVGPGEYELRVRYDDNTRGWRAELIGEVEVSARIQPS